MVDQKEKRLENLFWASLCCLAFFFPFQPTVTRILIGITIILWLLQGKYKNLTKRSLLYIALFSSYYFINYIGLIHSQNTSAAIGRLSSRLIYLVFPLILITSSLTTKKINTILWIFTASVLTVSTVAIVLAAFTQPSDPTYNPIAYTNLTDTIKHHPTYLSLNVIAAIFFVASQLFKEKKWAHIELLLNIEIYLIVILLLLFSRGPILGFLIASGFIFLFVIAKNKSRKIILAFCTFTLLLIATVSIFPSLRERFLGPITNIEAKLKNDTQNESSALHLKSWYCAVELLSDYHFFTGYGSGDEKDVLADCYKDHSWLEMYSVKYNAHDEYLSCLLRTGLLELFTLFGFLATAFYVSISKKNMVYFGFTCVFAVSFFFTTLNDFSALILLSYFNSLLFVQSELKVTTNPS
ncbi:MAG TPA: O-antigen ligase family protein [Cyclobacteriaceae bacterium]